MGISLTVCPHTRKLESHAHVVWACHLVLLQVVVQSLLLEDAVNKGFDLASKEEGQGSVTKDFKALFQQTRSGLWVQFSVRQTMLHHCLLGVSKILRHPVYYWCHSFLTTLQFYQTPDWGLPLCFEQ